MVLYLEHGTQLLGIRTTKAAALGNDTLYNVPLELHGVTRTAAFSSEMADINSILTFVLFAFGTVFGCEKAHE